MFKSTFLLSLLLCVLFFEFDFDFDFDDDLDSVDSFCCIIFCFCGSAEHAVTCDSRCFVGVEELALSVKRGDFICSARAHAKGAS